MSDSSQNIQNETEDNVSCSNVQKLLQQRRLGCLQSRSDEQADADSQEALNPCEAYAIELDQTHVRSCLA